MIHNDVYNLLLQRTAVAQETIAEIAEADAKINSGRYSAETVNGELNPLRDKLKKQLEKEIDDANRDAKKLVVDYQNKLRDEDTLKPEELTDDVRLLTAGVKLLPRDIFAMLNRNESNHTMQQLILRYAQENEIDLGKVIFVGNQQAIQNAEEILPAIDMYTSHWMSTDRAENILARFFGVVNE